MASYRNIALALSAYWGGRGLPVPLGHLLEARAWELLRPGDLSTTGAVPTDADFGHINVIDEAARHGLATRSPVIAPDAPGVLPRPLPLVMKSAFMRSDLGPYIGRASVDYVANLEDLWKSRIIGRGIVSGEAERAAKVLLAIGWPVTLLKGGRYSAAHNRAALLLDELTRSYNGQNLRRAAELARQSAANVAAWDAIYAAVKAVRDAPATVATGALGVVGNIIKANPLLVPLGILGVYLYMAGPKLAAKALRRD